MPKMSLCSVLTKLILVLITCSFVFSATETITNVTDTPNIETSTLNTNSCMEDLGCFPLNGDFYHEKLRNSPVPPLSRDEIDVKYLIYLTKSKSVPYVQRAIEVRNSTLKDIGINVNEDTIFIIHGFVDNTDSWIPSMKEEFFKHGNYNMVAVNWEAGSQYPYATAVSNTRVVGAEIAFFIKNLQDKIGLDSKKVHLIGHSLGAHITGYAGERIPNLGRITSLDPADPHFQYLPTSVRIDPSDAIFVEVIHTDTSSYADLNGMGLKQLVGHVDFFPNGGDEMPGCVEEAEAALDAESLVCNHMRCINYLKESINSKCQMIGYACKDWETFSEGKCASCGSSGEKCAIMGLRSVESAQYKNENVSLELFFKTNNKPPYCLYHYQGVLSLQNYTSTSDLGKLNIALNGSKDFDDLNITAKFNEVNGSQTSQRDYTFLITTSKDLGSIQSVSLDFDSQIGDKPLPLSKLKILPMFEIDLKKRTAGTREFCFKSNEAINSGKLYNVNASNIC